MIAIDPPVRILTLPLASEGPSTHALTPRFALTQHIALAFARRYIPSMQIFVFGSEKDDDLAAFTRDRDGKNLPSEFGPWKPLGGSFIRANTDVGAVSVGADAILTGIDEDGFFLAWATR